MVSCAIANCKNCRRNISKTQIQLHRFPTNPKLRKQWLSACSRKDKINVKNARICSEHFTPKDYNPNTKRLQKSAIPSLNLPAASNFREPNLQSKYPQTNSAESFTKAKEDQSKETDTSFNFVPLNTLSDFPSSTLALSTISKIPENFTSVNNSLSSSSSI